jgi:hypothetical protein
MEVQMPDVREEDLRVGLRFLGGVGRMGGMVAHIGLCAAGA